MRRSIGVVAVLLGCLLVAGVIGVLGFDPQVQRGDPSSAARAGGQADEVAPSRVGDVGAERPSAPRELDPEALETYRRLQRARGHVLGAVVDPAGAPVLAATAYLARAVRMRLPGQEIPVVEGPADAQGSFRITARPGTYELWVEAPGFGPSPRASVRIEADGERDLGPIVLSRACEATGIVRGVDAIPIAGARVKASQVMSGRSPAEATSDAQGAFVLGGLAEGSYLIEVVAPGRVPAILTNVAVGPARPTALDIRMQPASHVAGVIRGSDGEAVADAVVFAYRGGERLTVERSGASGRFGLEGLPEGAAELYARTADERQVARSTVRLTGGEESSVELALEPARVLSGRLLDGAGAPIPQGLIYVNGPGRSARGESDASGRFRFEGLLPATYELVFSPGNGATFPLGAFDATPADGAELDVRVPGAANLLGAVLGPAQTPVQGANVYAVGPGSRVQVRTEAGGTFSMPFLPAGEYTLSADAGDGQLVSVQRVQLQEGSTVRVDLGLSRAGRVSGRLVDGAGRGLEGIPLAAVSAAGAAHARTWSDASGAYQLGPLPQGSYTLELERGAQELLEARCGPGPHRLSTSAFDLAEDEQQLDVRVITGS